VIARCNVRDGGARSRTDRLTGLTVNCHRIAVGIRIGA
jgi:hypothetical protein